MDETDRPESISAADEDAIKELVKYEIKLAHEIHTELEDEDPDVAAWVSAGDVLPKIDDALKWLKDKLFTETGGSNPLDSRLNL